MKRIGIIATMLLALLIIAGNANAYTETDISFYQSDGVAFVQTYAQVEGNYWDWPSSPIPETPSAFVTTTINNMGSFAFDQKIIQFGTGQQWPDIAVPGEWSMHETQRLVGQGYTTYNKNLEVWSVHDGWNTEYVGTGSWNMPEGYDGYQFAGTTYSTSPTVFNHHVQTNSPFEANSYVWINPFQ